MKTRPYRGQLIEKIESGPTRKSNPKAFTPEPGATYEKPNQLNKQEVKMKKQIINFELDDELGKESQDKITEILKEAKAENIEIKAAEEESSEEESKSEEDSE